MKDELKEVIEKDLFVILYIKDEGIQMASNLGKKASIKLLSYGLDSLIEDLPTIGNG